LQLQCCTWNASDRFVFKPLSLALQLHFLLLLPSLQLHDELILEVDASQVDVGWVAQVKNGA
jgi:hypothetical protein